MRLMTITLAAVLSATLLCPAFARGGQEVSQAELDALQGDAVQAGATDQARVSYWNTMKPDRQKLWHQHCDYTASDVGVAQKDTAERQAFCKAMPAQ